VLAQAFKTIAHNWEADSPAMPTSLNVTKNLEYHLNITISTLSLTLRTDADISAGD
jgi:hypothetical protein